MKSRIIVVFFLLVSIIFIPLYFSDEYNTPIINNKIVLDIRNESTEDIANMYLKVIVPETFKETTKNDYYNEEITIPSINSKDRLVVSLDQSQVSLPGMQLSLTLGEHTKVVVDELHKDVGATIIINIKKDGSFNIKEVYNTVLQKKDIFYYKKYKEIIDINKQLFR